MVGQWGECGEEEKRRAEHLEGLPDGLLVEHGVVGAAVLDALEVLVLGPEGVAGALGRVRLGRGGRGSTDGEYHACDEERDVEV